MLIESLLTLRTHADTVGAREQKRVLGASAQALALEYGLVVPELTACHLLPRDPCIHRLSPPFCWRMRHLRFGRDGHAG